MIYLILAYEFFKIGLFSIGGGMATLPFLMDLTNKYDWFTVSELTNMVAISESTPGPVGINMATYAGYNAAGVLGAVVATLALTAPAWIIIIVIAKFLENFSENTNVKAAFYGIRPAVAALIGYAVWELLKIAVVSVENGKVDVNVINVVVCAAAFGLLQVKKLGETASPGLDCGGGLCGDCAADVGFGSRDCCKMQKLYNAILQQSHFFINNYI